jgi:hypothetical protein
MRRLITLISAGRNRTVMIRRELPRTRNADWAEKPYHIEGWRVLLCVPLRPVTSAVAVISLADSSCNVWCRPTGGGTMVKTGKTKPAIFSYGERVFAHRRQVPSRPSAASRKDRRAWTGGGDAAQKKRRKWQASLGRLSVGRKCGFGLDGDGPDKAQQLTADGGHDLVDPSSPALPASPEPSPAPLSHKQHPTPASCQYNT